MTEEELGTITIVHEASHYVIARYHSAQVGEVSVVPNTEDGSAGHIRYLLGPGATQEARDDVSVAGVVGAHEWSQRYGANWAPWVLVEGAKSDLASVGGSIDEATKRARQILKDNWFELEQVVERLHDERKIVHGLHSDVE